MGPVRRSAEAIAAGASLRQLGSTATARGTFLIELPTPRTVRALALGGFDFVVVDLEHSPFGFDALAPLVAEAQALALPVLVRVWALEHGLIGKVLDTGANGVMVPRVANVDEARAAVDAARYGPLGTRGLCPLIGYGADSRPQVSIDASILLVLQIEGHEGVANASRIADVPGIDGLFVGPYDLSQALGKPGDVDSADIVAAAEHVAASVPHGTMLGIYVDDPARSDEWAERGFTLQCIGFDGMMLLEAARRTLAASRHAGTRAVGSS